LENKIVFQSKIHHPPTRYTDPLCRYTMCLWIGKCEVRTPGRSAAEEHTFSDIA